MVDTYLEHLDSYLHRQEGDSSSNDNQRPQTTRVYHHHYDSGPPWWWWLHTPSHQTVINHNYGVGGGISASRGRDRDEEKERGVTSAKIATGVFFGSVVVGTVYYFSSRYFQYREEKDLLEGLRRRRNDYPGLYDVAKPLLKTNLIYNRNLFCSQLVIGLSLLSLLGNWFYIESEEMMNGSLIVGTLGGISLVWNYASFQSRHAFQTRQLASVRASLDRIRHQD